MRRLLTVSALLALALFATSAFSQPLPKPAETKDKKVDPTDAAIAAALARDPDVLLAKARIQLAEAELAKARLAVTQKVLAAQSAVQEARIAVIVAEQGVENLIRLYKAERIEDYVGRSDYRLALTKVEAAKAKLATAEAELKLLTGGAAGAAGANPEQAYDKAVESGLLWLSRNATTDSQASVFLQYMMAVQGRATVKGPIPDRIRAALDKPVKLGAKREKLPIAEALDLLQKEAGLNVPVRHGLGTDELGKIVSEGEEMPLGAWLQLIEDHAVVTVQVGAARTAQKRFRFYVREYGLLLTATDAAPPDAPTLTEFWKQKPPAKETKPEPKK